MPNNLSANLRPRIVPNIVTHVSRHLNGQGNLLAKVGQEVAPDTVLGQALVSAGFFSINLAKALGVSNKGADEYLERKIGTNIYKGELLAQKKTIFGDKLVTAPTDGIIEDYSEDKGVLRIKYFPQNERLTAGVYGIIDQVSTERNEVLIRTLATEIYGVAGIGVDHEGFLKVIGTPSSLFNATSTKLSSYQQILVVGALIYGQAFEKLIRLGTAGVVTGGINASDFKSMSGSFDPNEKQYSRPGISIVITEGFGSMPIGDDIFEHLSKHDGQFAFISGSRKRILLPSSDSDSIISVRKVVLQVNQWLDLTQELNFKGLEQGMKVRIIWPPFAGWQGNVVSIDSSLTTLSSDISTFLVTVETKNHKVKVPFTNLEIIG